MKYIKYYDYNEGASGHSTTKEIELDCEGKGQENDPLVIKPSNRIPTHFYLKNSTIYVKILGFKSKAIKLHNCKKITISQCEFKALRLHNCKNIIISQCEFKTLKICGCSEIHVDNSNFLKIIDIVPILCKSDLREYWCHDMRFHKCFINRLKIPRYSSSNIFNNCEINRIKNSHYNPKLESKVFEDTKIHNIYRDKSVINFLRDIPVWIWWVLITSIISIIVWTILFVLKNYALIILIIISILVFRILTELITLHGVRKRDKRINKKGNNMNEKSRSVENYCSKCGNKVKLNSTNCPICNASLDVSVKE